MEDDYKRVKDHNNKSRNDRITFPYFDDLNDVLGCKPRITPKKAAECGFDEQASPCASSSSCPSTPSSTETGDPNLEEPENHFLNRYSLNKSQAVKEKERRKAPQLPRKKQTPAKKSKKAEEADQKADYFAFLTESQNRDHDFFERLAERELKKSTDDVFYGYRNSKDF